jgi:putative Holliday junction resolvase
MGDDGHGERKAAAPAEITEDVESFAGWLSAGRALIGIDLGTRTIGLALSDVTRRVASPLEILKRTKFREDARRLAAVLSEHAICGIVLGLPRNLDGTEGPRAQATRAFARNFAQVDPTPLLLWDERLTTAAAERMLIEADQSRKRRSEVIDKLAATLILQGALDRLRRLDDPDL